MTQITLPENLAERRALLKAELSATIQQQIEESLKSDVAELLKEYGVTGKEIYVGWEFTPESDDEGGTVYYPSYLRMVVDGEDVEMEEVVVEKKGKWSDRVYEHNLYDEISDMIHDWREDLFDNDVESLSFEVGE